MGAKAQPKTGGRKALLELGKSGGVATRPRHAIDEAFANRIGDDCEHAGR